MPSLKNIKLSYSSLSPCNDPPPPPPPPPPSPHSSCTPCQHKNHVPPPPPADAPPPPADAPPPSKYCPPPPPTQQPGAIAPSPSKYFPPPPPTPQTGMSPLPSYFPPPPPRVVQPSSNAPPPRSPNYPAKFAPSNPPILSIPPPWGYSAPSIAPHPPPQSSSNIPLMVGTSLSGLVFLSFLVIGINYFYANKLAVPKVGGQELGPRPSPGDGGVHTAAAVPQGRGTASQLTVDNSTDAAGPTAEYIEKGNPPLTDDGVIREHKPVGDGGDPTPQKDPLPEDSQSSEKEKERERKREKKAKTDEVIKSLKETRTLLTGLLQMKKLEHNQLMASHSTTNKKLDPVLDPSPETLDRFQQDKADQIMPTTSSASKNVDVENYLNKSTSIESAEKQEIMGDGDDDAPLEDQVPKKNDVNYDDEAGEVGLQENKEESEGTRSDEKTVDPFAKNMKLFRKKQSDSNRSSAKKVAIKNVQKELNKIGGESENKDNSQVTRYVEEEKSTPLNENENENEDKTIAEPVEEQEIASGGDNGDDDDEAGEQQEIMGDGDAPLEDQVPEKNDVNDDKACEVGLQENKEESEGTRSDKKTVDPFAKNMKLSRKKQSDSNRSSANKKVAIKTIQKELNKISGETENRDDSQATRYVEDEKITPLNENENENEDKTIAEPVEEQEIASGGDNGDDDDEAGEEQEIMGDGDVPLEDQVPEKNDVNDDKAGEVGLQENKEESEGTRSDKKTVDPLAKNMKLSRKKQSDSNRSSANKKVTIKTIQKELNKIGGETENRDDSQATRYVEDEKITPLNENENEDKTIAEPNEEQEIASGGDDGDDDEAGEEQQPDFNRSSTKKATSTQKIVNTTHNELNKSSGESEKKDNVDDDNDDDDDDDDDDDGVDDDDDDDGEMSADLMEFVVSNMGVSSFKKWNRIRKLVKANSRVVQELQKMNDESEKLRARRKNHSVGMDEAAKAMSIGSEFLEVGESEEEEKKADNNDAECETEKEHETGEKEAMRNEEEKTRENYESPLMKGRKRQNIKSQKRDSKTHAEVKRQIVEGEGEGMVNEGDTMEEPDTEGQESSSGVDETETKTEFEGMQSVDAVNAEQQQVPKLQDEREYEETPAEGNDGHDNSYSAQVERHGEADELSFDGLNMKEGMQSAEMKRNDETKTKRARATSKNTKAGKSDQSQHAEAERPTMTSITDLVTSKLYEEEMANDEEKYQQDNLEQEIKSLVKGPVAGNINRSTKPPLKQPKGKKPTTTATLNAKDDQIEKGISHFTNLSKLDHQDINQDEEIDHQPADDHMIADNDGDAVKQEYSVADHAAAEEEGQSVSII